MKCKIKLLLTAFLAALFLGYSDEPSQNSSTISLCTNDESSNILLYGYEISWYNETTSELKLKKEPSDFSKHFGSIAFKLNDKILFDAVGIVTDANSEFFDSMVIYRDSNGKYYLNDCYPQTDAMLNNPNVIKNREIRLKNWSVFIDQLKLEKRLK